MVSSVANPLRDWPKSNRGGGDFSDDSTTRGAERIDRRPPRIFLPGRLADGGCFHHVMSSLLTGAGAPRGSRGVRRRCGCCWRAATTTRLRPPSRRSAGRTTTRWRRASSTSWWASRTACRRSPSGPGGGAGRGATPFIHTVTSISSTHPPCPSGGGTLPPLPMNLIFPSLLPRVPSLSWMVLSPFSWCPPNPRGGTALPTQCHPKRWGCCPPLRKIPSLSWLVLSPFSQCPPRNVLLAGVLPPSPNVPPPPLP